VGELPYRRVAVGAHCGQDVSHRFHRTIGRCRRSRQMVAKISRRSSEVDPAKHPHTLPLCAPPSRDFPGHTAPMHPDAAELSSITTVVADTARRIGDVAERRATDPEDPLIARLHEIERALITVERRLHDVGRALD
jgi:hypothetical protein